LTNLEIGRRIVEYEQNETARAQYGKEVFKELSLRLCAELGRGFSERNINYMRNSRQNFKGKIQDCFYI